MKLRSLGKYRLEAPASVNSERHRFFVARNEDEGGDASPSYIAKLLEPPRGSDAARRRAQFEHEQRLLEAINHPGVPTLHAWGEQDGVGYLVLDRVDGVSLATLLTQPGGEMRPLGKELAVYIFAQLADAVRHLHELEDDEGRPLGAVHRDLNPTNVLISRRGDVVVVDFASARSRWLPPEYDDPEAGHPGYMAPERFAGGTATPKSDVFALAVMLWEVLRGQRCFPGDSPAAVQKSILRFEISHSSRRVTGLSPKLGEIVRKNLDRDPDRRYTGAYQMLQRLAQAPEAASAEASRKQLAELVAARLGGH